MNLIKCEKLEKSMAELQFSIDAEAFKKAVADVFKKDVCAVHLLDQSLGSLALAEALHRVLPALSNRIFEWRINK